MIFNFWNIKRSNGLFYYGLDYLKNIFSVENKSTLLVIIRKNVDISDDIFPANCKILRCSMPAFLYQITKAFFSGRFIYTPTPHPLPFINNQIVVLHDLYPFSGRFGKIKEWLFLLSAKSSKCLLAYINHTDAFRFYKGNKFLEDRLLYAPNSYGQLDKCNVIKKNCSKDNPSLVVGLVGTDSPKKNYDRLFDSVVKNKKAMARLKFIFYGHETQYYKELSQKYSTINHSIIMSDKSSMYDYFEHIDILVSIAEGEGFGRPIASALSSSLPCYLIDAPVFREFFDGGAIFFSSVDSLVTYISTADCIKLRQPIDFIPPSQVSIAFNKVVHILNSKCCCRGLK
ncbi:glycosyltransferase [Aeromonas hydrophila]|uniref:glycosyltransferase n=1 Tax=Aeromonas hydrophila TaxID=644 RepID=UPI00259E8EDA|nr:glycosyltransferase [Aeromonas hydrophila]MDM5119742.1 glycosyltransferase [Aeromonas hydrophila]